MARLAASIVLRNPDSGDLVSLLPGQECPAWAADLISNPAILAQGDEPEAKKSADRETGEEADEAQGDKPEAKTPTRRTSRK